jgi:hypothetical protein
MYNSWDRKYHMGHPLITNVFMNQRIQKYVLHSKVNRYVKINSTQFPCMISYSHSSEWSLLAEMWHHLRLADHCQCFGGICCLHLQGRKLTLPPWKWREQVPLKHPSTVWFSYSVIFTRHPTSFWRSVLAVGCSPLLQGNTVPTIIHICQHTCTDTHTSAYTFSLFVSLLPHSTTGYWGGYWYPWGREQLDTAEKRIMRRFIICTQQISLQPSNQGGWDRYSMQYTRDEWEMHISFRWKARRKETT